LMSPERIAHDATRTTRAHPQVRHEWAPLGAQRFVEMATAPFLRDIGIFRCVKDWIAQTGLSGDNTDAAHARWSAAFPTIPDDHPEPRIPFKRGMVSFAGGGDDSRSESFFISYIDSVHLGGAPWETPFGMVIEGGMEEVADQWYDGYGEMQPFNKAGVDQRLIYSEGNAYLRCAWWWRRWPQRRCTRRAALVLQTEMAA
jgi:cyclophilin family peptidyl-prolyl cis-trans isomerase